MVLEAKTFKNGHSQAVRLPKEFRFRSDRVFIKKVFDGVVLIEEKKDFWKKWWNSFETIDIEREQGSQKREEIF